MVAERRSSIKVSLPSNGDLFKISRKRTHWWWVCGMGESSPGTGSMTCPSGPYQLDELT